MTLLVAGGATDPNVRRIIGAADELGVPVRHLLVGCGVNPSFDWDLESDVVLVEGGRLCAQAAFLRYDVFASLEAAPEAQAAGEYRAQTWYATVAAWLATHPEVRTFNRDSMSRNTNKLQVLQLAKDSGLAPPRTIVSNVPKSLRRLPPIGWIAKPVIGGQYTTELDAGLASAPREDDVVACPAIIQAKLKGPEVRVYVVGAAVFSFQIESDRLDYRTDPAPTIRFLGPPPEEISIPFRRLCRCLSLDFAAGDFKTDADTGTLRFLEVNSGPMFAAFDAAAGGELARAMVQHLLTTEAA